MTSITRDREQLINQITGLDFLQIRNNLVNFFRSQDQFTDYDFEGSNLSLLMDLLAYNTFYQNFYLNAMGSEAFLPTAVQRDAVVARAKQLGYRPRSVRSAIAAIRLTFDYTGPGVPPAIIPIPSGTKFNAQVGSSQRASFQTIKEFIATQSPTDPFVFVVDVEVVEGFPITQTVTITPDNIQDPITLTNANIDTTTLSVNVFNSSSSTTPIPYTLSDNITKLDSTSPVFFLEESDNLRYQITFGDGVLGKVLASGNVVRIGYLVSKAGEANGASTFSLASTIPNVVLTTNPTLTPIQVLSPASGGADIEDIPSIKVNAPAQFQSQKRAVTDVDYEQIIKNNFSFVKSISVWGGEKNIPVALGYVFISILPTSGAVNLSDFEKNSIEQFIYKNFSVLSIKPIVVDPDFLYLRINSKVKYDPLINNSTSQITLNVQNAILGFNSQFQNFGDYFRYSKLVSTIDAADPSIKNSLTSVEIERRVRISNQSPTNYQIEFYNPVQSRTLHTQQFKITDTSMTVYNNAEFFDDGLGNVSIGFKASLSAPYTAIPDFTNIGTIDYTTGTVRLTGVKIDQVTPGQPFETLRFTNEPVEEDVYSQRQSILIIDNSSVYVEAVPDV